MFRIYYLNFGYPSPEYQETLEEAFEYAKMQGFEAVIFSVKKNCNVASWHPIRGRQMMETW